ncbi:NTP pyrophosphatase, house-cleaning of non-canonical NTPs [Streptomyces sp. 3213]|uniref:MazG-like family protein n=1 Tax=Streptomyces sp. 3213.3 TaxID=1855348 RepID=UPI00089D0E4B|nr:MazG-like family protein [Streptomyces sp. 3213.3]SED36034.1 NTP pyrophosphatase, house-cleaning of non-canonical NTPs [Streptomyces sp. 3213] [Streptomyces sp. 3213.3]
MSDQKDQPADLWTGVEDLWTWVDTNRPLDGQEGLLLRILKLSEEVGEVSEAVIGVTGQNPRKGVTHTWDDVQAELCDVVITALIALRTLTPDAQEVFTRHLARVRERSLGPSAVVHPQDLPAPRQVGEIH